MLDEVDEQLLALSQQGLPLVREPYGAVARELGVTPGEVLARLTRLLKEGVVRRVAAIVDQRQVGLGGNVLVGWQVPEDRADEVGGKIAQRVEVTHCYLRAPTGRTISTPWSTGLIWRAVGTWSSG